MGGGSATSHDVIDGSGLVCDPWRRAAHALPEDRTQAVVGETMLVLAGEPSRHLPNEHRVISHRAGVWLVQPQQGDPAQMPPQKGGSQHELPVGLQQPLSQGTLQLLLPLPA
jgi:hypothetical protein